MSAPPKMPAKAADADFLGRFLEVISDPLNLLIERVPLAGTLDGNDVHLHNGNRVPVVGPGAYYGAFSQLLIVNRGGHEPLEEYVFQQVLRSLPTAPRMIELGAYWAHYSMWLKKAKPAADTIMVEPDPENLAAGRANFARNGYQGEFIQAAVGKGQWELDAFVRSRGLEHLDILHVDIQGAEADLINGGRDTLGRRLIDYLFVSTHSQALHRLIVSELAQFGYRIEVSSDHDDDTTSFDGFVLASRPEAKQVFDRFTCLGRSKIVTSRTAERLEALLAAYRSSGGSI